MESVTLERPVSKDSHPGRREGDRATYCPRCHNGVEPGHMDSHMFNAHGVDRRKAPEDSTPPPPEKTERRKPAPTPEGTEGKKKKGNVWFRRPE